MTTRLFSGCIKKHLAKYLPYVLIKWETNTSYLFFLRPRKRQWFLLALVDNAADDVNIVGVICRHRSW